MSRQQGPAGGHAVLCGFHPSLSYFRQAIPPLPAQRGATDASFNHFCPTDFDMEAKSLIALGTERLPAPPTVVVGQPLIESGVIASSMIAHTVGRGTLIPLIDWTGQAAITCVLPT